MKKYQYTDYDEYIKTQIETTERKLGRTWARPESIKAIVKGLKKKRFKPRIGMCHGARTGEEVKYFKKYFQHCVVYGTDIAPICKSKYVIVWDFHKMHPGWNGRFDFVYSNSWDHLFDPVEGLKTWASQIALDGHLILEHSDQHIEKKVNIVDSIGMTFKEFIKFVQETIGKKFKIQIFEKKKYLLMPFRHGHAVIWKRVR
jgi:hypothetical protein